MVYEMISTNYQVITHYHIKDKDFDREYYDIEIIDLNTNKIIKTFGNEYHDKGEDKTETFLEAIKTVTGKNISVEYFNIADRE